MSIKRITALSIILSVFFTNNISPCILSGVALPTVSAASAILVEAVTGQVLFEKSPDERRPMASTTKIMTTLLTLESGMLDESITVDPGAIRVEGSSMGLKEGDIVTKRALCFGMLLPSGNDAANASAVCVSGSIPAFAAEMNKRAVALGMTSTNFVTPSGLHEAEHYSTARDMSLLAQEAMKNADFREICSKSRAKLLFGNPPYERWLKNTNKLLDMYEYCNGIKTGFTDEAGRCLVSSAEQNGVTLICVTLNAPDDWNDHIKLFEYGFGQLEPHNVELPEITVPLAGENDSVLLVPDVPLSIGLKKQESAEITYRVCVPHFLYKRPPLGSVVGELTYYAGGKKIAVLLLRAAYE